MGWNEPDIYDEPDNFDLTFIDQVSWDNESYQFDYTGVWKHNVTGQLYMADDSGCSCPSPFENFTTLESLTPVTLAQLDEHLNNRKNEISVAEYVWDKENLLESIDADIYNLLAKLV